MTVADPGIREALECAIETLPEYDIGGPINVTGVLRNTSSRPVWILRWNTFLDAGLSDCAKISIGGVDIPFQAAGSLRGRPDKQAFVQIPPGDEVKHTLSLTDGYRFTIAGDYSVRFEFPLLGSVDEAPWTEDRNLQVHLIRSTDAKISILGDAPRSEKSSSSQNLQRPQLAGHLPLQPTEPNYHGFASDDLRTEVHQAHFRAYRFIVDAYEAIEMSLQGTDNRMYHDWFDKRYVWTQAGPWEERRAKVLNNLRSMALLMANDRPMDYWWSENPPDSSWWAYSYRNNNLIYFCAPFFDDDYLRRQLWSTPDWARAFSIVHELAHCAADADDHYYNWWLCEQLASFAPEKAIANAQNYALYASLRKGGGLPENATYYVRCYDQGGIFRGWLDSEENWLSLRGQDPERPEGMIVYWYEDEGVRYLCHTGDSRYLGDNGNGGLGNTEAAWNLKPRRTGAYQMQPSGQIVIKTNVAQHLSLGKDGWIYWSDDPQAALRFDFIEA